MRNSVISSALLAAALVCSPLAIATAQAQTQAKSTEAGTTHHRWHHHGHAMHRHGGALFKKLDLTDSQRTGIRQLMKQDVAEARPAMRDLHNKHVALRNATPGTAAYQSAAKTLAEASASATRARVLRRADRWTRIYALLTPAQRTKLADIRAQRRSKMEKWRRSHDPHRVHTLASPASPASASTK